jgi:hypothetical protein
VASALAGQLGQRVDEGAGDAPAAMSLVDAELVDEQLGALVRMGHLHTGDEPHILAIDGGHQQVMAVGGEEPLRPLEPRWLVEEVGRRQQPWHVRRAEPLDLHATTVPMSGCSQRRSMIVTLAWPPPSHIVCRP